MFGKDSGGSGESKLNSLLGKGANCKGDIVVDGGLKIDGNFKGTIKAHSLYVGKNASIEATIEVKTAIVGGKVLGDVVAEESLELQPKSELIGDVRTNNLIVAETAVLEGRFDMGMSQAYAKRPKLKPEQTTGTKAEPAGKPEPKAKKETGEKPKADERKPTEGSHPARK